MSPRPRLELNQSAFKLARVKVGVKLSPMKTLWRSGGKSPHIVHTPASLPPAELGTRGWVV